MQTIIDAHQESEEVIIGKIVEGDTRMFELLIRRYNPVLYRIGRSYGFNHQDCEDLIQDTHVAAYFALKQFEGRSSYKTWISKIMVHKCIYKMKYGSHKNEILRSPEPDEFKCGGGENKTEQMISGKELSVILERSLQNIPAIYRTVFVLREVEGFSASEVASLLAISDINVRVRLNRAKSLLQKQIEQCYSHHDLYAFNLVYCDNIVQRVFDDIAIKKLKPEN